MDVKLESARKKKSCELQNLRNMNGLVPALLPRAGTPPTRSSCFELLRV